MPISGREGQEMSSVQPKWAKSALEMSSVQPKRSKSALQKRREDELSDSELMFSDSDQHNGNGRTLQLIVEQIQAISVQQQEARRADRAEMRAAIANLAAKIEPQQISDEEEYRPTKRRATTAKKAQAFALPVTSHRKAPVSRTATTPRAWQAAMDPIARIRADEASHAQSQLLLQTRTHVQDPDSEIKSGYYRTLTDNQKYEVPWPCDTVYRANGKRATFDSMSMSEFVQGYLHIIATSLPLNEDMAAAYDHIAYLCDLMADAQHSDWSLVKNSHRQILHMVEQGQITWECAEARNTARAKQLQRAEKAAAAGKVFSSTPKKQGNNMGRRANPCSPFQQGKCQHNSHHQANGQTWHHICVTCIRVTGQRNQHGEINCKRKALHEARMGRSPSLST